jgi:hypothetical protein
VDVDRVACDTFITSRMVVVDSLELALSDTTGGWVCLRSLSITYLFSDGSPEMGYILVLQEVWGSHGGPERCGTPIAA